MPPLEAPEAVAETTLPSSPEEPQSTSADARAAPAAADRAEQASAPSAGGPYLDEAGTPLSRQERDPYLAQLAVTMTQQMTELTADATVLTRDGHIVAYSGELSLEDFRDLRAAIGDDWNAPSSQARIRYLRLPRGQSDFMVYSRGTAGGYSLSMVFGGGSACATYAGRATVC